LWRKHYPDRIPYSRNIFSCFAKRIKIKGVIQSQRNKTIQIRRPIRDERTVELLALTELNIYDSLRRREQDSDGLVNRDIIWRILKNNQFYL